MNQIVTATFDGSVFKPDVPITLPDRTRVRLVIELIDANEKSKFLEEFDQLCDEHPIYSTEPDLTRDQLHERTHNESEEEELWTEFDRLAEEFPNRSPGPMPTRDELHERR